MTSDEDLTTLYPSTFTSTTFGGSGQFLRQIVQVFITLVHGMAPDALSRRFGPEETLSLQARSGLEANVSLLPKPRKLRH